MSQTAAGMLAKAGRDGGCLECGAHWPQRRGGARELAARRADRRPRCTTTAPASMPASSASPAASTRSRAGYVPPEHRGAARGECRDRRAHRRRPSGESSRHRRLLDPDLCRAAAGHGARLRPVRHGARHSGAGGPRRRARIRARWRSIPFMVAGTGRFDTQADDAAPRARLLQDGAEGVYCAALPGARLRRRAEDRRRRQPRGEVALAAVVRRFLDLDASERAAVDPLAAPALRNWNGIAVAPCGRRRPSAPQSPSRVASASAPAIGESVPSATAFSIAGTRLRTAGFRLQPVLHALVHQRPHPFHVLRLALRWQFARRVELLAVVERPSARAASSPSPLRPETVVTGGVQAAEAGSGCAGRRGIPRPPRRRARRRRRPC